jgi:hypothetical protein
MPWVFDLNPLTQSASAHLPDEDTEFWDREWKPDIKVQAAQPKINGSCHK